ncbi:hypothetical protein JCM6882_003272 [Rhodosporidiobolus microsporus]
MNADSRRRPPALELSPPEDGAVQGNGQSLDAPWLQGLQAGAAGEGAADSRVFVGGGSAQSVEVPAYGAQYAYPPQHASDVPPGAIPFSYDAEPSSPYFPPPMPSAHYGEVYDTASTSTLSFPPWQPPSTLVAPPTDSTAAVASARQRQRASDTQCAPATWRHGDVLLLHGAVSFTSGSATQPSAERVGRLARGKQQHHPFGEHEHDSDGGISPVVALAAARTVEGQFGKQGGDDKDSRAAAEDVAFICPCCDRPFSVIYNLQRHMKTHPEVDISNVRPLDIPDMEVDRSLYASVAAAYPDSPEDVEFDDLDAEPSGQATPVASTPSPRSSRRRGSDVSGSPRMSAGGDTVENALPPDVGAYDSTPGLQLDNLDATLRPQYPPSLNGSFLPQEPLPAPRPEGLPIDFAQSSPFVPSMFASHNGGGPLSTILEGGSGINTAADALANASLATKAVSFSEPDLSSRSPAPEAIEMRRLQQIKTYGASYPLSLDLASSHQQQQHAASPFAPLPPGPSLHGGVPFPSSTAAFSILSGNSLPSPSSRPQEIPTSPRQLGGHNSAPHLHTSQLYRPYPSPQDQYLHMHSHPPLHPHSSHASSSSQQHLHRSVPLPPYRAPSPTESFRSTFARHRPQSMYASTPPTAVQPLPPGSDSQGKLVGAAPVAGGADADVELDDHGEVNTEVKVVLSPAQVLNEWDRLARTPPGAQVVRRADGGIVFGDDERGVGGGGET